MHRGCRLVHAGWGLLIGPVGLASLYRNGTPLTHDISKLGNAVLK